MNEVPCYYYYTVHDNTKGLQKIVLYCIGNIVNITNLTNRTSKLALDVKPIPANADSIKYGRYERLLIDYKVI